MGRALPLRLPIGGDRLATGPGCAMLAECPGQLLAELSVLFPEAAEFGACSSRRHCREASEARWRAGTTGPAVELGWWPRSRWISARRSGWA
jgi:hypothetical protein